MALKTGEGLELDIAWTWSTTWPRCSLFGMHAARAQRHYITEAFVLITTSVLGLRTMANMSILAFTL